MEDQEIRCFQHCSRDQNVLCFTVPIVCPLCGQDVTKTAMRIPPYLINSPFTRAEHSPCCVLVKPTVGSFLYDFTNESDLHVGLTDSNGIVHEFDERGVTVGNASWNQCLSVNILETFDKDHVSDLWDKDLSKIIQDKLWTMTNYNEKSLNCFDFVLSHLRQCRLDMLVPCVMERNLFCREMILPKTHKAGQYISLYRDIVKYGFVVQPVSSANK